MAAMARTLRARPATSWPAGDAGWVGPHWLERSGEGPTAGGSAVNEAHRRWTVLGALDSPHRARVDVRGLVAVEGRSWAIDWWIGAEDRWHVPAREASVRQAVLGATPVVETLVRVPGGDAVHRAFVARDAAGRDAVVIEIENATKVPFAVALSLRPYDLEARGALHDVEAAGAELRVDGDVVAVLPAAPRHAVASTGAEGDAAAVVFAGDAGGTLPARAACPDGAATLAVLHPLAHTATMRVVVPLGDDLPDVPTLPEVASVVSGWQTHARAGTRFEVPDRRLQAALDTSLRHLLLRADDLRAARALDRAGFHQLASAALADDLSLIRSRQPGAALAAVTEHWSAQRDPELARRLAPVVASLVAALGSGPLGSRRGRPRPRRRPGGEEASSSDLAASDRARGLARSALAAELLEAAGEHRAADDVRATQAAAPERTKRRGRGSPWGEQAVAEAAVVGERGDEQIELAVSEAAVLDDRGDRGPAQTLARARDELAAGRPAAAEARLSWALGAATGTWTWPSAIPAEDSAGGRGDGHDAGANAALVELVRELLVRDVGDRLVLAPHVPAAWLGQGWELHDAPTTVGRLSYAVRWHGERPALLWELEPAAGQPPVPLTAPGLDPGWSSTERKGEALLAPVAIPERAPRRGLSIPVAIEPTRRGVR
jgi:hypothetical protein